MNPRTARERLCFPLDYPNLGLALRSAERLAESVGVFKVGLELFVAEGPSAVRAVKKLGREVFLDLKLHDIPKTVERATGSATELGVDYLTLHALGGPAMIREARGLVDRAQSDLRLLAVTVLTSMDDSELSSVGLNRSTEEQVLLLAQMAIDAGAHGLVCSPREVLSLRQALGANALLVTPGVRPEGAALGDQKRTETPKTAIAAGADVLVVGRPIRDADEPLDAARGIVQEIERALAG